MLSPEHLFLTGLDRQNDGDTTAGTNNLSPLETVVGAPSMIRGSLKLARGDLLKTEQKISTPSSLSSKALGAPPQVLIT